jgi:hypothetical protein
MKERTFEVVNGYEGWTLYRREKDENGVWRDLPPVVCVSRQAAHASGKEWRMAIKPVRRKQ